MNGTRKLVLVVFLLSSLSLVLWYVLPMNNIQFNNRQTMVVPPTLLATTKTTTTRLNVSKAQRNATVPVKMYLHKESHKSECEARERGKYKPMTTNRPLTALASPWRSGNTWIRHLLQMATGIGTTSQYCDRQLQQNGFPYECAKGDLSKFIVMKTHEPHTGRQSLVRTPIKYNYSRAVVIIRDPYSFIVGNVYSDHLGIVPESTFFQPKFRNLTQPRFLRWWKYFNTYWLEEFKGQAYPVLYTNFLTDTGKELRKVLTFLGIEFTEDDIECATRNIEGNFHRKSRVWTRISNIKELFSVDMQRQVDNTTKHLSELLLKKYNVSWINENYKVNV